MEKKEFKLGQYVIGQNNVCYQEGRIERIEESTGIRKGLIYKVGINWFFADEIKIDQEGILLAFLKVKGVLPFGKRCKFQCFGKKYTLQGLCHSEQLVYVVATNMNGNVEFICTRFLKANTLDKIFRFVDKTCSKSVCWNDINIK